MEPRFDHEKLNVYRASLEFITWSTELLSKLDSKAAVKDQLDRASTSIPLNIAEGNGKFSAKDRARFFEIARGSAVECAAFLDVLVVRRLTKEEPVAAQKERLVRIVEMLVGLLRRFSDRADVLREEAPDYLSEHDYDYEHEQEENG